MFSYFLIVSLMGTLAFDSNDGEVGYLSHTLQLKLLEATGCPIDVNGTSYMMNVIAAKFVHAGKKEL
jgi:hypothetical protein